MKESYQLSANDLENAWFRELKQAIAHCLSENAGEISEYQLISQLCAPPFEFFDKQDLRSVDKAFYIHFPIFHCLHLLQNDYRRKGQSLLISPLRIRLTENLNEDPANGSALQSHDPLAAYYLNRDNLYKTSPQAVRNMVQDFWEKLGNPDQSRQEREDALELLGCSADASAIEIKQAYRRQAQKHHPDRGGEDRHFVALREAYECLMGASS